MRYYHILFVGIVLLLLNSGCGSTEGDDLLNVLNPGSDDDTALSNLEVSDGGFLPEFTSANLSYEVSVDSLTTTVSVTATERAENQKLRLFSATVIEAGLLMTSGVPLPDVPLEEIDNVTIFLVQVQSRNDQNSNIYTLNITR